MTRERSIETVLNVLTDWGSRVAVADRPRLAAYIVDALAQPAEVTDEMVRAFSAEMYGNHWAQHLPKPAADCQRERVRAALHAALEAGP